jgi:hypothetical protein
MHACMHAELLRAPACWRKGHVQWLPGRDVGMLDSFPILQVSPGFEGFDTTFTFREHNKDFSLYSRRHFPLHGYAFAHDFAITSTSLILLQNPVHLRAWPFVSGKLCPIHCMEYDDSHGLKVHVIPRSHSLADPVDSSGRMDMVWGAPEPPDPWEPAQLRRVNHGPLCSLTVLLTAAALPV